MEKVHPRWLEIFIAVARPGVMVAMFALLVLGGLLFAGIELLMPGEGTKAMGIFVGFFAAINDEYYETLRFMFAAYVIGRSGQEIAKEITQQKTIMAETATSNVTSATINAETATVNADEAQRKRDDESVG